MIKYYKVLGVYVKLIIKWYNYRIRIFFNYGFIVKKKILCVVFYVFSKIWNVNL